MRCVAVPEVSASPREPLRDPFDGLEALTCPVSRGPNCSPATLSSGKPLPAPTGGLMELRRFTVLNTVLIESLARQLHLPVDVDRTSKQKLAADARLMSAGLSSEKRQKALPPEDPRLIPPIVGALRESGQLRAYRPDRTSEFWNSDGDWYVYEETIATPVTLPLREILPAEQGVPQALTVWVLDPVDPRDEPAGPWDWLGSYVFIVQELGEWSWPARTHISGISALRLVVEGIGQQMPLTREAIYRLAGGEDVYGRWFDATPLQKLQQAGGRVLRPRKIETVYKIVYMTNEQQVPGGDETYGRINDILAYPLYIAE